MLCKRFHLIIRIHAPDDKQVFILLIHSIVDSFHESLHKGGNQVIGGHTIRYIILAIIIIVGIVYFVMRGRKK